MSAAPVLQADPSDFKSQLRTCLLFQEAPPAAIDFAAAHVEEIFFKKGECIILEKEFNDSVYFIIKGAVEIVSYLSEENRIQRLALLKAGNNFAEFSVLTKSTRSGSAYAFEDCFLLRMDGERFLTMLQSHPMVSLRLAQIFALINQNVETMSEIVPFYHPSQLALSQEVTAYLPLVQWQKMGVIPVSIRAGLLTVILKNPHNELFFQHMRQSFSNIEVALNLISESEFDVAVQTAQQSLKSAPKMAPRLSAVSPAAAISAGVDAAADPMAVLKASKLFSSLPEGILQQIVSHIKPQQVKAGTQILKSNPEAGVYYLIAKGQVQIQRALSGSKSVATMMTLAAGDGFGEVQILSGGKPGYNARAMEDCILFPIPPVLIQQLLKLPSFTMALAKNLAQRLQLLGHIAGLKFFKTDEKIDFKPVANLMPLALMNERKILPLKIIDNEIILCAVDPDMTDLLSHVSRYLKNYRLKLFSVSEEQFKIWQSEIKLYIESATAPRAQTGAAIQKPVIDVVKWVDQIILTGMKNRASDIHFEPSEEYLHVRFRIDGVLQESNERLEILTGREVVNRLKIISDMDISLQYVPQDGQMKTAIADVLVVARASCVPVRNGEKFVLRLIRSQSSVVPLTMIAPDRRIVNILSSVAKSRQGLFLVTGPTGSGKTTTLYSMLNAINDVGVNVTTLEDPVEMEIQGFNQIEVDYKRGFDFAKALRSVLRQDPNVIMVGEIRDEESAKIVFEASITGHLVLSTLHTTSSLDIAPRLSELGVSPVTIATGLLGVLSQRLLRANCKKCLTTRPTSTSEKNIFAEILHMTKPPEEVSHSTGCPACNGSGYHHRIPVLEVWQNSFAMQKALLEKKSPEELMKVARSEGFETLLEAGLKLVLSGLTSLEEVRRVLGRI
jgi:type II secretory ATPase GspE/PulE/Tfp pilus assembly ATPase PilB-like protein